MAYLTSKQALLALADGKVLENEQGFYVMFRNHKILLVYEMGKNKVIQESNYNDPFDKLTISTDDNIPVIPEDDEEEPGGP